MRKESRWGRPGPAGLKDPRRSSGEVRAGCTHQKKRAWILSRVPSPYVLICRIKKMQPGAIKEVEKVVSLKMFYATVPSLVGTNGSVAG